MQAFWSMALILQPSSQGLDMIVSLQIFWAQLSTHSHTRLPVFPDEDLDLKEQRQAHSSVPCWNLLPTEWLSIRKGCLLYATKFGEVCYSPIVTKTMRSTLLSDFHELTSHCFPYPVEHNDDIHSCWTLQSSRKSSRTLPYTVWNQRHHLGAHRITHPGAPSLAYWIRIWLKIPRWLTCTRKLEKEGSLEHLCISVPHQLYWMPNSHLYLFPNLSVPIEFATVIDSFQHQINGWNSSAQTSLNISYRKR